MSACTSFNWRCAHFGPAVYRGSKIVSSSKNILITRLPSVENSSSLVAINVNRYWPSKLQVDFGRKRHHYQLSFPSPSIHFLITHRKCSLPRVLACTTSSSHNKHVNNLIFFLTLRRLSVTDFVQTFVCVIVSRCDYRLNSSTLKLIGSPSLKKRAVQLRSQIPSLSRMCQELTTTSPAQRLRCRMSCPPSQFE